MPRDAMAEWLAKRNAEKAAQRATPGHGAVRQAQIKVDQILEQARKTTTALTGVKTGKTEKSSTPVRQEEGRDAMAEWLAARKESKVQQIAEQGKYAVRNVGSLYKAATGMWGELRKANEWQGLGVDAGIRQGYQARVPVRGGSQLQQQAENALQMDKTGPYRQRLTRVRGESLEKLFTDSLNQNQTAEQHGQTIRQELQELRTAGESGTDAAAAKEKWDDVASRLYYLAYSQSMSADEYNKLVSEVYDAYDAYRSGVKGRSFGQREQKWTDALRGPVMGDENYTAAGKAQQDAMLAAAGGIPEDRNTFGYELRYNQSTTRENIQYKSVDQLLDAAGKHVDPQADVTSQSQGAATDAAIFGYLANVAMTQEQYDRYMQALDRYAKNAPATRAVSGYGTSDVVGQLETYRQQREANGLRANEKGAEDALNSYPEMSAGSFLDQVASGSERARDNLFQKYPAGLEQLLVHGGGYAGKALGSLLNGFGAFENDLGDYFAEGGEKNINYQNPEWQEAKYQDWVRGRETSDLLQNGGKFERWAAEQISGLTTAALEMAAASTIAGAATGTMANFAGGSRQVSPLVTNAATKAEKFAQMAKQGSNIVTSSFAAINSYGEAESNGDARGEQFIRFAAGGLLEYGTNMLFGGNPLIDAGDTGKVTELVYKMTNNETIRKIVSSAAFDRIGEGLEEVASAIGSAALDYALTGEADLSWDELRDEFISGFALAMILSIGPDTAEVLAKNDHEGNAKRITMFDAAAQSDRGELNLQMEKYAVEFLAGDEDLMLANGWDHVQRSTAKKSWAQAVNEYNTVYRNLVDAEAYWAKTGEGKAYRGTDAERVIADARGSIEGVDSKTFSAETLEENVRQIRQAWDSAEENAANFAMTGRMDAEIAKMARTAESYLDKAVQDGTMDAMTALNLRNELSMINEGATANLQAYLNARYGEGTPQVETQQETVQEAAQGVNTIRAEAENNAAVNAAETGGIDNGRTEIFDGGSQRDAGLGTGEQAGGMAAGAAAAEGKRRNTYTGAGENGPANRRANLRPEDAARAERLNRYASLQSDTSLAQLVRGGSDAVTLAVVPESMYDDGMREAKQAGAELGVDVVFVRGSMAMQRGDQLMRINGVYDAAAKRAVVSATDIQYDGGQLAQHELFHVRANKDPALVQQALQKVRETFGEEAFEQVAREYVQSYSGAYQSMEDVYEEVLADAYAGMNRFRAGATQFTETVQGEVQQSERASEPAQTSQETRGSPEGKFSIQELENGERIAVIEDGQNEFDRAKPSQYAAIAKRVIKREFVGKTLPLGSEDLAMIPPDAAGEYAYPAQRLITKNANNAKMRASAELNNLLEVSEFSHWARDLKKHPEATLGFDYYTTKFEVGGHLFEGLINIANSEKGRVFYDITKIKEIPGTIEKRATPMAQSASDSGDLSGESVSQNQADVKQRFSLSEPVERAGNLIAEHNLTQEKLEKALEIGAFPSPSIAIVQAEQGHTNYGDYSVVFPASTIDPEADSRNRVYGADAWTPTSSNATVEYRVDADAKRAFERSIRDLSWQVADGIFRGDSTLGKAGIEEETTKTSREIAEQIAQYPEVKAAYLADKGENISPVYKDREYDNIGNAALQRYTDNVGVQNLARIIVQMYVGDANSVAQAELQRVRQAIGEEYAERFARILDRKPERKAERVSEYAENKMYSGTRAEDFIRHAWEMVQDGGQNRGEADKMAMQDELDRKAPTQKVAAWAEKRLQDVIGEGGIYNNEDRYTSRGDRRSFEKTHWELNAENLVRAMAQAEERGANIMWYDAGGLLAAATPEYRSISEIHADEGRLQTLEQEAYEGKVMELQQSLDNVVERILQETRHKAYGYQDESQLITEALIKTAQGGDSLQSIREGMAAEEYDIDRATAMQIQELFQQAKEIPTSYFETKPQRVVGFDEAVALLAPASAPADLMARAEDAGLRVIRYTDNADRIRVANELPGVKFSVQEELQDIRENGIRGKELASDREETQPEDVLGYADDMGEQVLSESYFRDWVQQQTNAMPQGFVWGKDVPFYSQTTDLSPKQAVELLEAVTGKRWRVEPRKNGGWRAVETDFAAKQGMYTPQEAANRLNAAKKARADADAAAYRNGEAPARATTVAAEGVAKDRFRATPALDKIGVKIDMGVTDYRTTKEMRQRAEAEYQTDKLISKAERRWGATALEKNFARDIAAGRYSYADIPDTARWDTVTDLANLYIDKRMLGEDLRLQRKYAIRDALLYKAMELLPDELELMSDPGGFDKEALLVLNYRTPQRSMLKMFGDKRGEEINRYYFDPVTRNEAERLRWMNRQLDAVREFQGEGDKVKGLNKAESAYVHMALDIEATVQRINQSPNKAAIQKAVTELTKMETAQKASPDAEAREAEIQRVATDLDLNAAESKWAQQYAQFLTQKDGIKGEIDEKKCAAAVKQYRQLFDDYYNAIADFLVSHGDEPIGKIDYYAPHLSTADKVNLLNQAFEALGFNASATRLPAEIAGRTEDFRPNKRWTPFFQSREGTQTEYDIVHGFESYVTYLSDVLFHTDDIQKIRALENYTRLGGKNDFKNSLAEAIELSRSGQRDEKLDFLRELKRVDDFAEPTTAEINKQLDQYIAELFAAEKNNTRYSDLAVWLKNYGDVLAGKQFGGDRGAEHRGGRGILKLGTQLTQAFARANVAGNVSSAVNQIAQLPTILGERSKRSIAQAALEFSTGKLRQFQMDSDFITGKKGVDYISNTFADSFMSGMFKPAEFVDTTMSTIAARAAYLDAIRDGKTHEEAMRAADAYARSIMGDRTKGAKPLMFHSKTPVMQMVNMFQIEALNSWEHVSQDLPRQFRQIAAESGKAKAARVLSSVILKTVLAAFVVNRVTEEIYGGTPAPFDIIGMSMNFIASGEGLTTNDWIRYMFNKASNAMFGVDLFDDVPTPQEGFDWGNAVEDTLYNISNEVPFLSNLSGMVGVGDRTLMMPDLFGKGKDLWDAATEHGLLSPESGEALLGLVTQAIPGGRQINKTYSGIKTIVEGGRTKGFGDKERLQYPVERNVGTALQNILFGPNATPQANAYWASGLSSLSTKDTQTWQTLSKDGADPIETYNLLHEFIKINADDTLTSDQAQRDIRDAINNSGLTDEQKAYLFRQEFGRRNKETGEYEHATDAMFEALMDEGVSWDGVTQFYNKLMQADGDENLSTNDKNRQKRTAIRELDVRDSVKAYTYAEVFGVTDKETGAKSTSKDEAFANMMDAGMSWDDVMDVYEEYRTLYEDESLSSSQQASEFAYWLDQHNIKGKKREAIQNGLKYYQMFAQEAERYTNLTEAGLSATDAKKVSDKLASAKGTGENGQLTTNDKVDVLLKQNLTDTSLYKALSTVLSEETYDKLTEARSGGIGAKIWMQYWRKKAELSADKDANGKSISGSKKAKILALINSLQLTAEQKDLLYRAEGYAERDLYRAPWH
nr:MAG TPA: nuclease [Caudoviricetes sp.]